jgi:mono/diheme cytochrome c family protein
MKPTTIGFRMWLLLVYLVILSSVGCGQPDPADRPVPADQVMDFDILYRQNCAGCHGNDGKLGPAPPLNDPLFRALVPEHELHSILTGGRAKTLMPAFAQENGGPLSAAQIQVLVKEIKGIPYKIVKALVGLDPAEVVPDAAGRAPKWGLPPALPTKVPAYSVSTANSVAGSKAKGAQVFARACAICHGGEGQGNDGARTINDPVFLALISDQALRRYAITGRPDLRMPSYAQPRPDNPDFVPLTDEEVTHLVSLLASWRKEK